MTFVTEMRQAGTPASSVLHKTTAIDSRKTGLLIDHGIDTSHKHLLRDA